MGPENVFITGCNRGIGLELTKYFLTSSSPPKNLFATCRDKSTATELTELSKTHSGKLHVLIMDITDYSSYEKIMGQISNVVGDDGLNLVINNAGMLCETLNQEAMRQSFEVNTIAPYFLTLKLAPLLKKAARKFFEVEVGINRAAVIMMSSSAGSIAEVDVNMGIRVAYRTSKTALNMAMRLLALEMEKDHILVTSMHPGWVKTDMGGPRARMTTQECCSKMIPFR